MNPASLEPMSVSIAFFTPGLVVKGPGVNSFLSSETTFGPIDLFWMVSMISEITATKSYLFIFNLENSAKFVKRRTNLRNSYVALETW